MASNSDTRYYTFTGGGHILEAGCGTMLYIRQRGHELAITEPKKRIDVHCAVNKESKLEYIGGWTPEGLFIDYWGNRCRLSPDAQSLEIVKKHS